MLDNDLSAAVRRSLDDLVVDELDAFTGQLTRSQGADTLGDYFRKAKGDLEDQGYIPDLIVMSQADAENFDTLKDGNDKYLHAEGAGVWGMSRVVSTQVPAGTAYVLDTSCVTVYTSPLSVEADYSQGFTTNTAILRVEGLALCVVRQGAGTLKFTYA